MTFKRSLENRIRGWFPKEPYMISTRTNIDYETKKPPLVIPPEYKVSATKVAGAFAIFWTMLYGYFSFTILDFERYPVSSFQIVPWIIAGTVVGVIISTIFTKNQLRRLSRDYQFSINGKDMVLLIAPLVLFFVFGISVGLSYSFTNMSIPVMQGFLISFLSLGISLQIIRYVLFVAFEKKENMSIVQSWFGFGFFLIPKAPNSNVSHSETTAKKELSSLTGS